MCKQSMKSIKYLFFGVITTLALFAWSSWAVAQTHGTGSGFMEHFAPNGASPSNQCVNFDVNFDEGGSMSFTRGSNGCDIKGREVVFYQKPGCPKKPEPSEMKKLKKMGNAQCTGTSFGCDECVKQTKNSPYIIEFWNGTEMVSYCYDFDGAPQDCNLPNGTTCSHSAQCTSGNCSGGTCQ